MLPWLIGAAVLGVGAAILSSSKDSSSSSSSSSSDYKDREKEAKERERQAAIESSQRLIDHKFSAIKCQWRIKDAKQNKFLISKYNHSAATDSNSSSFVVPLTICEQEEKFKTLQTELEQLNRMFAEVNGALNSARSSLQNGDYSEDIPTVDASTVDVQIVKDHPFKSSHTSSHTIKVNDKRAARNPFDVTGYTNTVKVNDKRAATNPLDGVYSQVRYSFEQTKSTSDKVNDKRDERNPLDGIYSQVRYSFEQTKSTSYKVNDKRAARKPLDGIYSEVRNYFE